MHDREVDVDLEGAVEVVGQHVHGDVADDVAELSIAEPGAVGGVDVAVDPRQPLGRSFLRDDLSWKGRTANV